MAPKLLHKLLDESKTIGICPDYHATVGTFPATSQHYIILHGFGVFETAASENGLLFYESARIFKIIHSFAARNSRNELL